MRMTAASPAIAFSSSLFAVYIYFIMVTLLCVLQSSPSYYYEVPSFFSLFKCRTNGECQTVLHGSNSNGSAPLRNRFYQQQQQQQQQQKKKKKKEIGLDFDEHRKRDKRNRS